ncbi:MAG: hypothetical protein H5T96_09190 [Tissierellales bacterium]|nr:hypothetical protein [Tissierellales bacterium]
MIVKVEDLKIGDKILVPGGSKLRTLIVVKEPVVSGSYNGHNYYKSVRCTEYIDKETRQRTKYDYGTKSYKTVDVEYKIRKKTFDNHNTRISIDLSYKDIWLVERENN